LAIVQSYDKDSDRREIVNSSLIQINDDIIVNQTELEDINIKIYLNPTSDFLHIVLPTISSNAVNYMIYNELGQLVSENNYKNLGQNYIQLDVRNYTTGNYLLIMEIDGVQVIKNFVVNQ